MFSYTTDRQLSGVITVFAALVNFIELAFVFVSIRVKYGGGKKRRKKNVKLKDYRVTTRRPVRVS